MNAISNSLFVRNATPRTHLQISGVELAKGLAETPMTEANRDDLVVMSARDGSFHLVDGDKATPASDESVLPLRFGPLNEAFATIGEQQGWLLAHQPVIKTERDGDARIDFINYGGFVFQPGGEYVSHTVNGW